jgi:AraC family transcriptional regulator
MKMLEPQIIYKASFRVVGIPLEGEAIDNDLESAWEKLADRYSEIPHADPDQGFGVHTFSSAGHRYLAGLAVAKDGCLPDGMAELGIDPHAYAVFTHRGDTAALPETITAIFDVWLPESGYKPVDEFYFEYYDDHFQPGSPNSILFIFVPVIGK